MDDLFSSISCSVSRFLPSLTASGFLLVLMVVATLLSGCDLPDQLGNLGNSIGELFSNAIK